MELETPSLGRAFRPGRTSVPTPPSEPPLGDYSRLIGHIDQLREDASHLLDLFNRADDSPDKQTARVLREDAARLRDEVNLAGYIDLFAADLADPLVARDWTAGTRGLQNEIRKALDAWPEDASGSKKTQNALTQILVRACELVLPDKIERRLAGYRLGKPMSMQDEFDYELPNDPALRAMIIQRVIAQVGRVENGIAEPSTGVFYRRSENIFTRALACLSPLLAFLACGGLFALIAEADRAFDFDPGWNLDNSKGMIGTYIVMTAGAIVHMLVESTKAKQRDKGKVLAITDGLDWLYLRWPSVVIAIIWMVVGTIMLRVTSIGVDGANGQLVAIAFATGYSLDSFIGMWSARFDATVGKNVSTLADLWKTPPPTGSTPPRGLVE